MSDEKLKDYVEEKIWAYTFHAKNFSKEDMDRVDKYCKEHFGNDRKKMILTLISMVEGNTLIKTIDNKLDLNMEIIAKEFDNVYNKLDKLQKEEDPTIKKKVHWKGFSDTEDKKNAKD